MGKNGQEMEEWAKQLKVINPNKRRFYQRGLKAQQYILSLSQILRHPMGFLLHLRPDDIIETKNLVGKLKMIRGQTSINSSQYLSQVGIIGGGQLAWMMAQASIDLGISLSVQTPSQNDPVTSLVKDIIFAPIDDINATAKLAETCDVITFENEFVDCQSLGLLAEKGVCFRPSLSTLSWILDKYDQRSFLQNLGLPTPKFWGGVVGADFEKIMTDLGQAFPLVLKARRHGYDGQGTFIINNNMEFVNLCHKFGEDAILLEEFIPFTKELAVVAVRGVSGEIKSYPIVETQQENQVCRRVITPVDLPSEVVTQIDEIIQTLLKGLNAVGVWGIELFLTAENQVLVNEIAPRTHNSGHLTIDACKTSQFEQHLRAVCQLPLGGTDFTCAGAVMVNLLGYESTTSDYQEKREKLAKISGSHVYWYGKNQARPGRKLGHVTVTLDHFSHPNPRQELLEIARKIESIWYEDK